MRVPKIKVSPQSLAELMSDIEHGHIRVPRFQREFVWERSRILKLLDSMFEEYPIGTIFLWKAPTDFNHMIRNIEELEQPTASDDTSYRLILDGQQRLTSLYAVIKGLQFEGEDYRKIVVDLESNGKSSSPFRYRNPDNRRWVSVSELLSASPFAVYEGLASADHKQTFTAISDALRNYPFSVVTVTEMSINDAIEIFERINQQGRRLTRYDLICASVMTDDFDLRDRSEHDIVSQYKSGFGTIAETSIPQALALNKKGSTEHSTQLGLTTKDILEVWDETVDGFHLAVEFVRKHMGVARKDFLPYDAMLPILVHYFFQVDSHAIQSLEHRKQLDFWFWRSTFSQRYSGASQTRMTEDASWIRQLVKHDSSYGYHNIADENDLISASMRSTTSAVRNGILCLLSTMKPLHFKNKTETNLGTDHFSTFTRAEKHHIFPAGFLRDMGYPITKVHSIPNFCFIPAELNKWIGDRAPSDYMRELRNLYDSDQEFQNVMSTHLIPVGNDSALWSDNYELFLLQRARLLIEEIKVRCGITTSLKPEKRDPVVNRIEIALRDTIHDSLLAYGSEYWKQTIPGDVRKRVEQAIEKHVKKTPGSSRSQFHDPRRKLDFCDVSDYSRIIVNNKNWNSFAGLFKSKTESERVLDDFRDFRAALKHNRPIDSLQDHRAQAAILWLKNALQLDLQEFGM
ncbi:MAG: DUF262 domain-containing protein [Chloroflexi bacterium]|nr:DUF262 domain-containing protein [Chloroflexota bacterium]